MADLPIVCTLTPDALRARRAGLLLQFAASSSASEAMHQAMRADSYFPQFHPTHHFFWVFSFS
jgi:hypothetical protein